MSSLSSQMCKQVTSKYCWAREGGGTLQWAGITGWRRNKPLQLLHGSEFSLHPRNKVKILTEALCQCMSQTRLCSITTLLKNILPPHQILTGQNITISVLSHIPLQFTSFCTVWFSFVSFQGLKRLMSEEPV